MYYVEGNSMSIHTNLYGNPSDRFFIIGKSGKNITITHYTITHNTHNVVLWENQTYNLDETHGLCRGQ